MTLIPREFTIDSGLPTAPSPGEVHVCHNDWANIVLATPAALGAPGPTSYPQDELTTAAKFLVVLFLLVDILSKDGHVDRLTAPQRRLPRTARPL